MAKKYILRSFNPGGKNHNKVNTLINLSALGLNAQLSIIKNSLAMGASETSSYANTAGTLFPYDEDMEATPFQKYKDITKNSSESYAYYDLSYPQRVEYMRQFAEQQTIAFILNTIADECCVVDENNYIALLDTDLLKTNISANSEEADRLIDVCDSSFKRIYAALGWDKSNGAWNALRKFLIEGYLSYEIIYDNLEAPTKIVAFKYVDPITLEPGIQLDSQGREIKVWYQNKGDADQRLIPDTNMIYISWHNSMSGEAGRISYLEGLTRSFNMLTQIENSRIVWNVQNAQKRVKISVPVGDLSPYKADALVNQIKAEWTEEVHFSNDTGELIVNGSPQFSFNKTYFFPQRNGQQLDISEIPTEGYSLESIEPLKYFWRRFILETQVPANRFMIDPAADGAHPIGGSDANSVTREEYAFSRFINRVRTIFREILLKPTWIQICLTMPQLAKSEYLKQALGIVFNEENLFVTAKENAALTEGVNMIQSLYGLQDASGKPVFSMKFLVERFLNFSADDMELNEKYKQQEIMEALENAKHAKEHQEFLAKSGQAPAQSADAGGGFDDFGGGGDFGGDAGGGFDDFGGGDDFGTGAADAGGADMSGDAGGGDFA